MDVVFSAAHGTSNHLGLFFDSSHYALGGGCCIESRSDHYQYRPTRPFPVHSLENLKRKKDNEEVKPNKRIF